MITAFMIVWWTAREDKTLQAELAVYQEFTYETKYRLLPGSGKCFNEQIEVR